MSGLFAVGLSVTAGLALAAPAPPVTTSGAIAIVNLDFAIAHPHERGELVELLLARARFLADETALERAAALTARAHSATDLLLHARVRAAAHRFGDALRDAEDAQRQGAPSREVRPVRQAILVATGRAAEVLPALEDDVARRPTFATHGALATAYAAVGRFDEADAQFAAALAHLDTTLPFPYAWFELARGTMWLDEAHRPERAAPHLRRALAILPQLAPASIHLAEVEALAGDDRAASARLEALLATTGEPDPEALAMLGMLHLRGAATARGSREIEAARRRFETLLALEPRAFADHAAEFYLGPGKDAERAFRLARLNLAERRTRRALALALRAARATGRMNEARRLAIAASALPGAHGTAP